jgi:plasmid stability protein
MTITIPNLPNNVEQALRNFAAAEHKSLDAAAVEALARGLGVQNSGFTKLRDLSFMTEAPPLEPEVMQALEEQRQIDPES